MAGLYKLWFDDTIRRQWFLAPMLDLAPGAPMAIKFPPEQVILDKPDPRLVDSRIFNEGKPVSEKGRLYLGIQEKGKRLDLSFADADTPVVNSRGADFFSGLVPDDIQLVPVEVEGEKSEYHIMNIVSLIDCLDRERTPGNEPTFFYLRDRGIGPQRIFRVKGREFVVIVTEAVKQAIEEAKITGASFRLVS